MLQAEEGNHTITTLQSAIIIAFTHTCVGKDRIGYTLYGSALAMATDMGLTNNAKAREDDQDMFFVEQTTIWGLFYLMKYVSCKPFS